jgi:hypothetical protein
MDTQVPVLDEKYFDGGQCRIYKVDFPDQESWAIRIPLHMQNVRREAIIDLLQGEILIVQELELKGFQWAPRLQGSSLTFENLVGYPFIALSWVSGESLSWSQMPATLLCLTSRAASTTSCARGPFREAAAAPGSGRRRGTAAPSRRRG